MDSYGGEIGGNILSHNPAGYYALRQVISSTVAVGHNIFDRPMSTIPIPHYREREATRATTKDDTKVQVKPILPHTAPVEQNKPCTTAEIRNNDVERGERLTILESIAYVELNKNVMCDTQSSAFAVASRWNDSYLHYAHQNGAPGYYPHYHPWDGPHHPHIWFFPTP